MSYKNYLHFAKCNQSFLSEPIDGEMFFTVKRFFSECFAHSFPQDFLKSQESNVYLLKIDRSYLLFFLVAAKGKV